ncbi:MAG: ADOP family duplicated permease [Gemmatimonadota bacterium]
MLDSVTQDLKYAWRQLQRAPVFTLIASASLAMGIGVAVSALSVLNAIFFKPLPVPDPEGIYRVYTSDGDGRHKPYGGSSYADYEDFLESGVFAQLAAHRGQRVTVTIDQQRPLSERIELVSPNFFNALGVQLPRGRGLSRAGDQPEIVLNHRAWQRAFNGDPSILGRIVRVNGLSVTVVGIAPNNFGGTQLSDQLVFGWVPATAMAARGTSDLTRGNRAFELIGRLPANVTRTAAYARLDVLGTNLAAQYPVNWIDDRNEVRKITLLTQRESLLKPGDSAAMLMAIGFCAALVLLVLILACTNVAGLLLAKALARRHEIAVRLTIGASRARLLRQLLTESIVLALIGGALGTLATVWAVAAVSNTELFNAINLRPDWSVFAGAIGVSLLCALLFGFAPATQSLKADLRSVLGSGSLVTSGKSSLRGALIAVQVSVSFVLILLALVAARGVSTQTRGNPGFQTDGLVLVFLESATLYPDSASNARYVRDARQILESLPGVQSSSIAMMPPLSSGRTSATISFPGGEARNIELNRVGPGYFHTIGIPVLRGRVPDRIGVANAPRTAVVNETFARSYGREVVGELVDIEGRNVEIVGVVKDVKYHSVGESALSYLYAAADELAPLQFGSLVARVAPGADRSVMDALRTQMRERHPEMVPPRTVTMLSFLRDYTQSQRFASRIALTAGGIELALAAVGLYGLLLFALMARTREIGLRLALGAEAREASWAVMRDGVRFAAIGGACGLLVGVPAALIVRTMVVGVNPEDPVPFIAALTLVLLAAGTAAYIPARRAARIEPAAALRTD